TSRTSRACWTPRRASATTSSSRTSAAVASTPRSSPTALPSSARSGSPPATRPATRRSATRSPAASTWADPAEQGAALPGVPRRLQRPRRTDEGQGRDDEPDVLGASAAPHDRLGAVPPVAEPPGDAERPRVLRVRRRAGHLRAQVVEREQHDGRAHLGADPLPLVAQPDPRARVDLAGDREIACAELLRADHPAVEPHQE